MRGMIRALGGLLLLTLAACGGGRPPAPAVAEIAPQIAVPRPSEPLQCVPYARQVSGIDLRGDAWTWWLQAEGRYARGKKPRPGAVLVFRNTRALPRGHLSVVTRMIHAREIVITHANWGSAAGQSHLTTTATIPPLSFPRRRESREPRPGRLPWMLAFAGMTRLGAPHVRSNAIALVRK